MSEKKIFLIDFDMTISYIDSTDTLLETHNPEDKTEFRKKFKTDQITMREYIKYGLESLNITKEEFLKTLEKITIDETFIDFTKSGVDFRIVSAGTKLNISGSLLKYNLNIDDKIISNDIEFDGNKITVLNPYLDKEMYYGVDKKEIVKKFQNEGYKVYFVGDGPSDYRAMEVADYVFVRKGMRAVKFCQENNIDFKEFNNFNEILSEYKK